MSMDDFPTIGARDAGGVQQFIEQFLMPTIKQISLKIGEIDARLRFIENEPEKRTIVHRFPDTIKIKMVKDGE